MTESKTLTPSNHTATAAEIAGFKWTGGMVFAIGGMMQGILTLLIVIAILARNYVYLTSSFYQEEPTWSGLWEELGFESPLLIANGSTALLLMVPSFLMGRWAGRMIGLRKLRYGWVGLISAMITAVFGSICMSFIAYLLDDKLASEFRREGTLILALFTLIYLVPGIATGLVSGLVTRQKIRSKSKSTANA